MAQPAFDHLRDARDDSEEVRHRLAASAQQAASRTGESVRRAGAYVQTGLAGVAERAQDLAHGANGRIERLTGRPVEEWPDHARHAVRRGGEMSLNVTECHR